MSFSSIKGVQGWYGCFYFLYIFTVHIFICCMTWQLFHSPHFNYSIDFPPFNVKRDLPYVTQRFPGDGGLGPPQGCASHFALGRPVGQCVHRKRWELETLRACTRTIYLVLSWPSCPLNDGLDVLNLQLRNIKIT